MIMIQASIKHGLVMLNSCYIILIFNTCGVVLTDVTSAHISAVTQTICDQHLQQHFGEIEIFRSQTSYRGWSSI